jgi:hypothetical protein
LEKWTRDQVKVETVIFKIRSAGANCDHEIIEKMKRKVNGGSLLVVIE